MNKRNLVFGIIIAMFSIMASAEIKICTGGKSGKYSAHGTLLTRSLGGSTGSVVNTKGSWENMSLVSEGTICNAAIVQADAFGLYGRQNGTKVMSLDRVGALHKEYVHLLVNGNTDIDDFADFESGKYKLAIGEPGSGSWVFMQSIIAEDEDYKDVPLVPIGGLRAATKVADGTEIQGMVLIGGIPDGNVSKFDGKLSGIKLVDVEDDKDFNDAKDMKGNTLYEFATIPNGTYPISFQKGILFGKKISTLSMQAILIINVDKMNTDEYEALLESYAMNLSTIQAE